LFPFSAGGGKGIKSVSIEAGEGDYMPTRYPDAVVGSLPEGLPKKEHAQSALGIASRILKFVKNKLGV